VYGVGYDWLGLVLEAAGGQALDDLLGEQVFGPLGMRDTTFRPTDGQRSRCVPVHVRDDSGGWITTDIDWDRKPDRWSGGHGLYSTPRDFLRFQQMLLGGGALGDARILDRASVDEAFTGRLAGVRIPAVLSTTDPAWSSDFLIGPGSTWGWGMRLSTGDRPGGRAAGSGSWTGVFNTSFWVDPRTGVTGALYTQALPFCAPPVLDLHDRFEPAVYEAAASVGPVR
jgi:CubicO group peptidase (beta-lactamase class C family)